MGSHCDNCNVELEESEAIKLTPPHHPDETKKLCLNCFAELGEKGLPPHSHT
jgi:hypothetical protein